MMLRNSTLGLSCAATIAALTFSSIPAFAQQRVSDAHLQELIREAAKLAAMRDFVEYVNRGRWSAVRPPSAQEIAATMILAVPLVEASAKIRTGFAVDHESEYGAKTWTGVLPFSWTPGEPIPDPRGNPAVPAFT